MLYLSVSMTENPLGALIEALEQDLHRGKKRKCDQIIDESGNVPPLKRVRFNENQSQDAPTMMQRRKNQQEDRSYQLRWKNIERYHQLSIHGKVFTIGDFVYIALRNIKKRDDLPIAKIKDFFEIATGEQRMLITWCYNGHDLGAADADVTAAKRRHVNISKTSYFLAVEHDQVSPVSDIHPESVQLKAEQVNGNFLFDVIANCLKHVEDADDTSEESESESDNESEWSDDDNTKTLVEKTKSGTSQKSGALPPKSGTFQPKSSTPQPKCGAFQPKSGALPRKNQLLTSEFGRHCLDSKQKNKKPADFWTSIDERKAFIDCLMMEPDFMMFSIFWRQFVDKLFSSQLTSSGTIDLSKFSQVKFEVEYTGIVDARERLCTCCAVTARHNLWTTTIFSKDYNLCSSCHAKLIKMRDFTRYMSKTSVIVRDLVRKSGQPLVLSLVDESWLDRVKRFLK